MKRSTIKTLGLALLIPGLILGLLPVVAMYTSLLADAPSFNWAIGDYTIANLEFHGSSTEATVTPLAWVAAASGELLLIWMHLTRPQVANRFDVSPR